MKTAGTALYFLDPDDCSVVQVGCPTSLSGLDSTVEQIETTCLENTARTYEAGLATPGTATFALSLDPNDPSHTRLLELKKAGATLQWAIGWSDGIGIDPTGALESGGDDCEFTLPTTRTWVTFEGFVNSFAFAWELNAIVQGTLGIQVSGDPDWIPKST